MKAILSRALMALAARCLGENRREWAAAMRAEYETAAEEGTPLRFAAGCLVAAWREMLASEEGRFVLANYALILGLMMPMAALQIGCALFGLPYLYPGQSGLPGALLDGGLQESLLRGVYQAAIVPLALLQLLIGLGHFRIAWLLLERDWAGVTRSAQCILAAAATLVIFMSVLFLNGAQALTQLAVMAVELMTVAMMARRYAQLVPALGTRQPD